ncbi:5'-3' exonuclease [Saccharothrix obliqua]|uniref:5'-3' exonuclease n=1 Tax=Saccharothrix obliqua TaxID=2861747 RepID=UPI001C5FAC9E|nr:5'-3' exonuclease H3TH domain-containing protein [Saccharothrix obliqua]MBW4717388.1 flap endonuclease [Saccharothrix obliqua]
MTDVPLLLVDGHNLLWRGAFGFPAAIHSRDKTRDLTAEFAFFALLRVAIREEFTSPPEVIVVFDGQHGAAERQATDSDYKANRGLDEAALKPIRAIPHVQQALTAYELAWIEIDTAEADDVIATLVTHVRRDDPERRVWIMSGDRDFYQLIDDRVRVLNTTMKRGRRHIEPDTVFDRYRVQAAQWADFRALTGDPADNIPGVRGVGTGTAAKLLAGGLTLGQLADAGRLTGAKGKAVAEAWDQLLDWRDLIRMRTDLALPLLPTGHSSRPLPTPAEVIDKLGLW